MKYIQRIKICAFSSVILINICFSQNFYEEGRMEYFKGNLKNSIELFGKSINMKEEISKSYMLRGAAKAMLSEFSSAFNDLDSSLRIDSSYYKTYFYYGKAYALKGAYFAAMKYFNKAISKNSKDAVIYDNIAIVKVKMKDFKDAITNEDIAIGIDSLKAESYTCRGWAKYEMKLYNEAILDYNKSLNIKFDLQTYLDRGIAYAALKIYDKAITDFSTVVAASPKNGEVYYYRGLSYKAIGSKIEACLDFEKSVELKYSASIKEQHNCIGK